MLDGAGANVDTADVDGTGEGDLPYPGMAPLMSLSKPTLTSTLTAEIPGHVFPLPSMRGVSKSGTVSIIKEELYHGVPRDRQLAASLVRPPAVWRPGCRRYGQRDAVGATLELHRLEL